jgi:hypothetical protein
MPKTYAYSYNGSALAAQRPIPHDRMIRQLADSMSPEKFEIYELVPVRPVTKSVTVLERK